MKLKGERKEHFWVCVLLGGVFLLFFFLLTPLGTFETWIPPKLHTGFYSLMKTDPGDDAGYYAYLRSAFFDGDFDFLNELNYVHSTKIISTGYAWNPWLMGQSILFFPFFLLGHFLAMILNAFGYQFPLDGYSEPYYFSTAIASATYIFAGLVILYNLLRKWFGAKPSLLAVLSVWLGSPLLYYTFIRQRMAHGTEFFGSVIFGFLWIKYRRSENIYHHAIIGCVLGFLCMVRLINVVLLALYFGDLIFRCFYELKNMGRNVIAKDVKRAVIFILGFLVVFSPQMVVWNQLNGNPIA